MPADRPGLLDRISRTINRTFTRGPRETISLAKGRIGEWMHSEEALLLMVRSAEQMPLPTAPGTPRWAAEDDAATYARDIGSDSQRSFRKRLRPGTRCFVVEEGGRFHHASWVTSDRAWTREIGRYLSPPPGDAYVYESFTHPVARGHGIYPLALVAIVNALAAEGVQRVWVGVDHGNAASRKAIAKAGFQEGFRLRYGRRWGRIWVETPAGSEGEAAEAFLRGYGESGPHRD